MKTVTFFLYSWIKCQQSHHPLSWSDPKIWSQRGLDSFPLPPLPQIAQITKTCQLDLQITVWLHLLLSFNTATSSKTSPATWISTAVPLAPVLPLWPPYSSFSTSIYKNKLEEATLLLAYSPQVLLTAGRINSKSLPMACDLTPAYLSHVSYDFWFGHYDLATITFFNISWMTFSIVLMICNK